MGIRKRGKTWWIDFTTPSGQRVRQSAQTTDKRAAQELHDRLRSESWRAGKLGEIAGRWFEEGAARWLSEATHKASIDDDAAKVQFFRQHFAGKRLDEITRDAVDRLASPMNPATANRHVAWIRAMLRKAEREWGWLDRAPAFKTYKEPKRRIRWLTPDEFSRLHAALPARYKDPAQFAVLTGLRQGNVIGLEWSQVDLDRKFAWVHPDQAKARRAIGVPLNGEAVALLRRQPRGQQRVFGSLTPITSRVWARALKRAGLADFRWHDIRHTWASWHVQRGTPLHALQELGGWESAEMVRRYAHLAPSHLALYANAVGTSASQPADSCVTPRQQAVDSSSLIAP
jgi:integrase